MNECREEQDRMGWCTTHERYFPPLWLHCEVKTEVVGGDE